jgi:hypothetical protein
MSGPRDEDDDDENRDTDEKNEEYEPQDDEAELWQVRPKYPANENQDRSMERVA